ncbi:ArsR/SmtB family transcription factor [Nocardia sp. NPDC050412]|uniref:ArsR/SmtB family transcription factor n=1 Tax=Nocardia sp. NPDC050412 TaxID=3364320 RepID=UPI003797CF54
MSATVARIFEALGDPVRRYILELVAADEQSAGTIVAAVQQRAAISQPGVSQHLKVLRDAGLVSVRAEGTRRLYLLDRSGLDAACLWLTRLADPIEQFAQPLDALATEIARGKRPRRAANSGQSVEEAAGPDARHA